MAKDRRAGVIESATYNGIDYVEIATHDETVLKVHFLNAVPLEGTLTGQPTIEGGERIKDVLVLPFGPSDWEWDEAHILLTLRVAAPGDFSTYTLAIPSPILDPFFDNVAFSFKANCPSDLDCQPVVTPCPPISADHPSIDYLSKDFLSFRQALLDFSAQRYPQWQERSEADFGVMFLEALSAFADDLSYTQDRVATEATLPTATQRRSLTRHARLVDYEPAPLQSANALLQFDVAPDVTQIPYGVRVLARAPDGTAIPFETGTGLLDQRLDTSGKLLAAPPNVIASSAWNRNNIEPYWLDDSQQCLRRDATGMNVLGHGYAFQPGQQLLIETQAETSADPPIRQVVRLVDSGDPSGPYATEEVDDLLSSTPFTHIVWRSTDALTVDRDLARTMLAGNIAPATQGATIKDEPFIIAPAPAGDRTTVAVIRAGARPTLANGTPGTPALQQFYTLGLPPLTWLPYGTDPAEMKPEILLLEAAASTMPIVWRWLPTLLNAREFDAAFTIDAARYAQIALNSDGSPQYEYCGDGGDTVRFGDGVFGMNPDGGTRFSVTYRIGSGASGNVAAGAISQVDPLDPFAPNILAVSNPLPAIGGADAQSLQSVQRLAPQKFRNDLERAVLPADYVASARTLPWVEAAGSVFRWTGSWLTVFTTAQPFGSEQVALEQRVQLVELLNRRRMAGYESYAPDPRYVSLDLSVVLCAQPPAFRGDVEDSAVAALRTLFAMGAFTFGQPLERSVLERALQAVPGVAGVSDVEVRVRGHSHGYAEMGDQVPVATDQILRCDDDPTFPERGSLSLTVMGGR